MGVMGRPYGKVKRKTAKRREVARGEDPVLKIRLRGNNGAPLSRQEIRDGLFEVARRLASYEQTHRAKWATIYLTMVDDKGKEVIVDPNGEWEIVPCGSAADAFDR